MLAFVSLFVAFRHDKIKWQPSNMLDVMYLYYLPFCMVFVSEDRVHRALAPSLIRPDQSFVTASEFKQGLRQVSQKWASFSEHQKHLLRWALGTYPPPLRDCVVWKLTARHLLPWKPGRGNQAITLSATEEREALALVAQLFKEAGEPFPI